MKLPAPVSLLLLLVVFAANAFAATPATPAPKTPGTHDRVELKITKVFSAREGDAVYRAYQVEWNGQEVVIDDTLAQTNHRVGDVVTVLVLRMPPPPGKEGPALLHFTLGPPRRPEPPPAAKAPPAKETKAKR